MKQWLSIAIALASIAGVPGTALSQASPGFNPGAAKPKTGARSMGPGAGKPKEIHELPLDELYSRALSNNPDILAAESKVREAQQALHYLRSNVLRLIATAHREFEVTRELDKEAQARYEHELQAASSAREKSDARLTRIRTKQEFAKAEGMLLSLVGKPIPDDERFSRIGNADGQGARPPVMLTPPPLPDAVRKALDTPIAVDIQDQTVADVIADLQNVIQGVNLHVSSSVKDRLVTLRLKQKVPAAAVFQWLEDQLDVKCVLRDYGIVLANRDAIPPGAVYLLDAWRKPAPK